MIARLLASLLLVLAATPASGQDGEPPPPAAAPVDAPPATTPPSPPPAWPAAGAVLRVAAVTVPPGFGTRRVFVEAGHGVRGNPGNTSSLCIEEQEFTLRLADDLARRLGETGAFTARTARSGHRGPTYQERLVAAQAFGAEVILSLHSDVRGVDEATTWSPRPGQTCQRNDDHPGFAVLYSPAGPPALAGQRRALAQALARHLTAAGLLAYDGADYDNAYTVDPDAPGAFRANINLFWLRRPAAPSVIIETHHAWDTREERAWSAGIPWPAFAAAVAVALVEVLAPADAPAPPSP